MSTNFAYAELKVAAALGVEFPAHNKIEPTGPEYQTRLAWFVNDWHAEKSTHVQFDWFHDTGEVRLLVMHGTNHAGRLGVSVSIQDGGAEFLQNQGRLYLPRLARALYVLGRDRDFTAFGLEVLENLASRSRGWILTEAEKLHAWEEYQQRMQDEMLASHVDLELRYAGAEHAESFVGAFG